MSESFKFGSATVSHDLTEISRVFGCELILKEGSRIGLNWTIVKNYVRIAILRIPEAYRESLDVAQPGDLFYFESRHIENPEMFRDVKRS